MKLTNILLIVGMITIIFVTSCTTKDYQKSCQDLEGNWIADFNECEFISADSCQELGGIYDECASACRNDPKAQICTMQCVQVCKFE